jgi:hypothetical protein
MLSAAEEDLLAGKVSPKQPQSSNFQALELPPPVLQHQQQQQSSGPIWSIEYWQIYFNVNTDQVII